MSEMDEELKRLTNQLKDLESQAHHSSSLSGINGEINIIRNKVREKARELDVTGEEIQQTIDEIKKYENDKIFKEVADLQRARSAAIQRLHELNKAEQEQKKQSTTSEASALQEQKTPFGYVNLPINHLENIIKDADWKKEFCDKYQLEVQESPDKLVFTSPDKKDALEVNKTGVKGNWDEGRSDKMIVAMIELYLKSCKGAKDINHKITSNDTKTVEKMTFELAQQLKASGVESASINGKSMKNILQEKTSENIKP